MNGITIYNRIRHISREIRAFNIDEESLGAVIISANIYFEVCDLNPFEFKAISPTEWVKNDNG